MFWPINIHSSKRNGRLHPSINVDCTLDVFQDHIGTTDSSTHTNGCDAKKASQVETQPKPAEYEIPIKSPPASKKEPVPLTSFSTIYEMPTVPHQTAYLTEDFKKKPA